MEGKGNGTGEEASSKIAQAEERVENVPPPLSAAEIEEHDRADRDYFDRLPPGYRFEPTDGNLIAVYLKNRILNLPLPRNRIRDVNVYDYHPHQLTSMYKLHRGKKWYFFTRRTKQYRLGKPTVRAAGNGFWKNKSDEDPIYTAEGVKVGTKRKRVYYEREAKEKLGTMTNWNMHEYRTEDENKDGKTEVENNGGGVVKKEANHDMKENKDAEEMKDKKDEEDKADNWVLCVIYERTSRKRKVEENQPEENNRAIVAANEERPPNENQTGVVSDNLVNLNAQVQDPNTSQSPECKDEEVGGSDGA